MIFDTDVLIWCFRGNARAGRAIEDCKERRLSAVTLMELHQGARDKSEQKAIGKFVRELNFEVLPIDENISHRACIYVEEFCLQASMQMADALIAATAVERGETLCTANHKHYKAVSELEIKRFKP
jgi:Predicted nucleic acid-binding protein, contains PIN domain